MKLLTYYFLWLFVVTNTIAAIIYTGYYFLFIPQFNAALPGWLLVVFSLVEIPLILRSVHAMGTRHRKWLLAYIICKIFCILLVIKWSVMVHSAGRIVTVAEALTIVFLSVHAWSLIIIYKLKTYTPRSARRPYTASFVYLLAVCMGVVSAGFIGADIYTRIQTEYYAMHINRQIKHKSLPADTASWKTYVHPREPKDRLPGFEVRIPPTWKYNDNTFTISTSSAQLTIDRSGTNSKLCLYPDTSHSDTLYNNHIYVSLIPVFTFTLNGRENRVGLMPVQRHSTTLQLLVCERWIRFDGLAEYTSDVYNQNIGNVLITINRNDTTSLQQLVTILQTIAIRP